MDYKKVYKDLVTSRKNKELVEGEYYEKHHIIPKCLGGSNKGNLVHFTGREHFIAHWLLNKMFKDEVVKNKMLYAFGGMAQGPSKRKLSPSQYEKVKKAKSKAMSIRMSGKNHPMYGKTHTKEAKRKISEINKGRKHSKETKKKISESMTGKKNHMYGKGLIGEKNGMYGKTHSEESKRKMSEAKKGTHLTEEHKKN